MVWYKRSPNCKEKWLKKGLFVNLGTTRIVIVRSTDRVRAPKREVECARAQPQMPEILEMLEREPYPIFEDLLEQEQYGLVTGALGMTRGDHCFCLFCGSPLAPTC